jgi:magnesium-protoporphyrin O-methyltransferase
MVFTFAPRTPLLALMHSAGRLFPRSDRSPSLSPVAHADLLQRMQKHIDLQGWQGARMQRVASGFYTSQAWEWTRS